MFKLRSTCFFALFIFLMASCTPQQPLVVTDIVVNLMNGQQSTELLVGAQAGLSVTASGQDLQFEWSASSGNISDRSKPSIIFTAPKTAGAVTISVQVKGGATTITRKVDLKVVSPTPIPTSTRIPSLTPTVKPTLSFTATQTVRPTIPPSPTFTLSPTPAVHSIFSNGKLAEGYDMGVNTSFGYTNWVTVNKEEICMNYPSGQEFGFIGITFGKASGFPRPGRDLSIYNKLSFEVRGETGKETIEIGIKDNKALDDGRETKVLVPGTQNWNLKSIRTDYQQVQIPLSSFSPTNLQQLYIVFEIVFGKSPQNLCVKNIFLSQ